MRDNLGSCLPTWQTITTEGAPATMWRKSSFSDNPAGDCVEVALTPSSAAVRDSKHTAPELRFPAQSWKMFTPHVGSHRTVPSGWATTSSPVPV